MHRSLGLLSIILLCAGATARDIHYGAVDDPALNDCDALEWRGQRDDAGTCYRALAQRAADPAIAAEAAWALGDIKAANRLFQAAAAARPDDATIGLRWGELFRNTYQFQDAFELINEALERDPGNAFATVAAARLLADRFEAEAGELLAPLLHDDAVPAGAKLGALLLMTRMALEDGELEHAAGLIEDAERLATAGGLPMLEVYALAASLDLLKDVDDSQWIARGLAANPAWGGIYATPAYFYEITRRYREAVALYREAVAIEPELWLAQAELGINLLRLNEVADARAHLERAYGGDPYNPKAVNSLRLLDSFESFDVLEFSEPDLLLRLDPDERAVLAPYAQTLAADSIATFAKRYRFAPTEPVVIEIYPNHEDFVVRTTGMPGLGILGVSFGYVVAMDSPTGHPEPGYHWGSTLWHEVAHVFTLEATDHRVPRWFSEGISVFEEWRTGPISGTRLPLGVYEAIAADKFLPVAGLDRGFVRPTYPGQVIVSYMQAGLICEFIEGAYGFDALVAMLAQYKDGADTIAALEAVLELTPAAFDAAFTAYVEARFGARAMAIDDWRAAVEGMYRAVAESDWLAVIEAGQTAVELLPDYVEADSPYLTLAAAYAEIGRTEAELETLETYWLEGGYAPNELKTLAAGLDANDRRPEAIAVLESVNYVAPFDVELHTTLGDWLLAMGRSDEALSEYELTLALSPHDRAAAHYRIARAHHALENPQETRTHLLAALEIAPHYRPAQKLLLETAQTTETD